MSGVRIRGPEGEVETVRAGIVIGADGRRSAVARLVGARRYRVGHHATAVVYGYWRGVDLDGYHWYYRPGVSAGAIATNDGHCVFASTPAAAHGEVFREDPAAGYQRVLDACDPSLGDAVRGAEQVGKFFTYPGVTGHMRQSCGPGWALVGDAGYFKDPLTAHGITDALRDAEVLAHAVAQGSPEALAAYQVVRDRLSTALFDMTDEVASYGWNLERIKTLHIALNKQMNREVDVMTRFDTDRRLTA